MLIVITAESPGCVFEIGQLIRVNDQRGQKLIDDGYAQCADGYIATESAPKESGNPFMQPPMHLHKCGYVAGSAAELVEHDRSCK